MTKAMKEIAVDTILKLADEHRINCIGEDCQVSLSILQMVIQEYLDHQLTHEEFKRLI